MNDNIVGIDAAIFMHPLHGRPQVTLMHLTIRLLTIRIARSYRADVLIEEYIGKIEAKINKDVAKSKKRFGDDFNEEQFRTTNPNVLAGRLK